jgi:hypothetical protein
MQTESVKLPRLPSVADFLALYEGADPALISFIVPMVLSHGVAYTIRYLLTEKSNKRRFDALILAYIEAFEAGDVDKGAEIACKLMDLAESIWAADA